ncbi:hypothetical protein BCR39DRAFT_538448 [Naematelia encephala]|uniref:NECAP PHear domain-containing protein n=1 Tax=Naematelia encephala TaxID=71784 RepID=A0A1Y2AZR3_9TREE|nr:hypothetical protein BCR39DRAFT_538448 [Naematelia encephala]
MDDLSDEIESILYVAREVMVYQVPPRTSTTGYKAADWDVEQFMWKGRLRVVEIGSKCELRLEDATTGELFAQVTYVSPWTQVEPVLDSSRYFVLRVEGEGGKRAYIGMGFQERGDSFDFQVALQSVAKRSSQSTETDPSAPPIPKAPPKDYSLKQGQTFTIKIPGREGKKVGGTGSASSNLLGEGAGAGGGGGFSLPPPPPPGSRKR